MVYPPIFPLSLLLSLLMVHYRRVDDDVECYCNTLVSWNSVVKRFTEVQQWLPYTCLYNDLIYSLNFILISYAGVGGWNDLDSLDVGNAAIGGLNNDERYSCILRSTARPHFSYDKIKDINFWALAAAPFYTGNDLTQLDSTGLSMLTNPYVIKVNQLGIPAVPTKRYHFLPFVFVLFILLYNSSAPNQLQVWYIMVPNTPNTFYVGLFNLGTIDNDSISPFSFSFLSMTILRNSIRMVRGRTEQYLNTDSD